MRSGGKSPIGSILFGLLFLGVGILAVFIFSRIGELSCTRLEPSYFTCVRNTKLFGIVPFGEDELPTIRQAYVSESCDSDGCSYRVDMVTDEGDISLVDYYTGGMGAYNRQTEKVTQINAFVNDSNVETLDIGAGLSEILLSFLPMLFVFVGAGICIAGLRGFMDNI